MLCEDCARKYLKERLELTDAEINTELESMKHVLNRPFGYIRFSTDGNTRVTYKETDDGWLETDTVVKEDKEIFKKLEGCPASVHLCISSLSSQCFCLSHSP